MNGELRVAIVHDYLNQMGGAERVVAVLHQMFPQAPIYTTIVDRERLMKELKDADIRTTWMQKIPGILKRFKLFFWLYPFAVQSMNLRGYDLIISSSSAYAKGAPVGRDAIHICYCHTPMRFAWDFSTYMEGMKVPRLVKWIAQSMVLPLKLWDKAKSRGIHHLIANSSVVQKRIKDHYGLSSTVIFPPVGVSRFHVAERRNGGGYFLIVSRLVSYKRIDLAVEACTKANKQLVVIGDGPDRERLQKLAGPTVQFLGRLPDIQVVQYMKMCRALIFPGIEDFGITPLEANACGRPVIAFRGGGALDTIIPGLNGQFFAEQKAESLAEVIAQFDEANWDPVTIRRHAEKYDEARFIRELSAFIEAAAKAKEPTLTYRTTVPETL
ncbi:glycosyltransferase [Paenibacillus hamazuiensis]|uniref:glycosyltransferase n=1 Tax=Paenibacillus hamazuiensis TaxID=2936508 RepID=UPI00200ED684|nr:glycosyltransferase [Paenibacillus hamazuiensis]